MSGDASFIKDFLFPRRKHCYFVDLFVRVSNKVAVDMYRRLGYSVYRRVLEYYSGDVDEDAFGMYSFVHSFPPNKP